MKELTLRQMSETNGGIGFRSRFFSGFLCGASSARPSFRTGHETSMTSRCDHR